MPLFALEHALCMCILRHVCVHVAVKIADTLGTRLEESDLFYKAKTFMRRT